MQKMKDILDLFDPDFLNRMSKYAPAGNIENPAKVITGRLLEEITEYHLACGGSATSAIMHVTDSVTNECFKSLKQKGSGGINQTSYPSRLNFDYNYEESVVEAADVLFVYLVSLMVNGINFIDLKENIEIKLKKLEQAANEGRLTITDQGTFYIQKD